SDTIASTNRATVTPRWPSGGLPVAWSEVSTIVSTFSSRDHLQKPFSRHNRHNPPLRSRETTQRSQAPRRRIVDIPGDHSLDRRRSPRNRSRRQQFDSGHPVYRDSLFEDFQPETGGVGDG